MKGNNMLPRTRLVSLLCVLWLFSVNTSSSKDNLLQALKENRNTLYALVQITDPDSLSRYFDSLPTTDQAVRVVYYTLYLRLASDSINQVELLKTMPQSVIEFRYFYCLTYRPFKDKRMDDALAEIADGYFELVTRLLLKHRSQVQDYFRMADVIDGEITETYATWCSWLLEQDCRWFLHNLERAHPAVEKRVLGLLELDRPRTECLQKNRDQIPKKYLGIFGIK